MKQNITLTETALLNLLDELTPNDESDNPKQVPCRFGVLARMMVDRVSEYRSSEALAGTKRSRQAIAVTQTYIRDVTDDWCGTSSSEYHWPWPPRFDSAKLRPIDLLAAGTQFRKAASLGSPLQAEFSNAADKLFDTGLKRIKGC